MREPSKAALPSQLAPPALLPAADALDHGAAHCSVQHMAEAQQLCHVQRALDLRAVARRRQRQQAACPEWQAP
jgi:hypothetical protein